MYPSTLFSVTSYVGACCPSNHFIGSDVHDSPAARCSVVSITVPSGLFIFILNSNLSFVSGVPSPVTIFITFNVLCSSFGLFTNTTVTGVSDVDFTVPVAFSVEANSAISESSSIISYVGASPHHCIFSIVSEFPLVTLKLSSIKCLPGFSVYDTPLYSKDPVKYTSNPNSFPKILSFVTLFSIDILPVFGDTSFVTVTSVAMSVFSFSFFSGFLASPLSISFPVIGIVANVSKELSSFNTVACLNFISSGNSTSSSFISKSNGLSSAFHAYFGDIYSQYHFPVCSLYLAGYNSSPKVIIFSDITVPEFKIFILNLNLNDCIYSSEHLSEFSNSFIK